MNKEKIILVNYIYYDCYYSNILSYPIGLLSLQSIINQNSNFCCEIVDLNLLLSQRKLSLNKIQNGDLTEIIEIILGKDPIVVGLSTIADTYEITLRIGDLLKELKPDLQLFLGGPQASVVAEQTMSKFECVDMVCIGESENNIIACLEYLREGRKSEFFKSVCYRENDEIILNSQPLPKVDLEKIPHFNLEDYAHLKSLDIEVGRGCPFKCIYCSTSKFWDGLYRVKSVGKIIDEIIFYKNKYSVNSFCFQHDLFTFDKNYIVNFCNEIIERKLDVKWGCSARADTLNDEMIDKMSLAGCNSIFIGVESGSKRIQKLIKKNLDLGKMEDVLSKMNSKGIHASLSFIYDMPFEEEEDFVDTINLIFKLKKTYDCDIMLNQCTFYPGTEMYDQYFEAIDKNKITNKNKLFFYDDSSIIYNNVELFSSFFSINRFKKYEGIEICINFYLNVLYFLFPNVMRAMYSNCVGGVNVFWCLQNFILKTANYVEKQRMDNNRNFLDNLSKLFFEYVKEYYTYYSDEIEFDLLFVENKCRATN